MCELRVRAPAAPRLSGKADLGEYFVRGKRGLECSLEVIARADVAAALRADGADDRVVRECWRGLVGSRIGVREAAADGAACADLEVTDRARGLGERDKLRADVLVVRDRAVRREGPHHDGAVGLGANLAQRRDAAQIDEHLGLREPELHERKQAVATGDYFRL